MVLKTCTRGASVTVAIVDRATEQTGALEKAWLKVSPSFARVSQYLEFPYSYP